MARMATLDSTLGSKIYASDGNHECLILLCALRARRHLSIYDAAKETGFDAGDIPGLFCELRSLGYDIKDKGKHYELLSGTRRLLPWELSDGLKTEWIGSKVYYMEQVGSTQDYALKLAGGSTHGHIVAASRQTDGRGRTGKIWHSPDGGIWLSVILKPAGQLDTMTLLPLAASSALAGAIKDTMGIDADLKWPNDVLVDGKKAAGIIIDSAMTGRTTEYMVLGVGINFEVPAKELECMTGIGVASLADFSEKSNPINLTQEFLRRLERAYMGLSADAGGIIAEWQAGSSEMGRTIKVVSGGRTLRGKAAGIDKDGALILESGTTRQRVLAGDTFF